MKWYLSGFLLLFGLGIVGVGSFLNNYTTKKIAKMEIIRGFQDGGTRKKVVITDKFKIVRSGSPAYWVSWNHSNIRSRINERLNLPPAVWKGCEIGSEMVVVFVPGDPSPYHQDGIFASDGNFAFDRVLKAIWVAIIWAGALVTAGTIPLFFHLSKQE